MVMFTDVCRQCGKSFPNHHTDPLEFCAVGCQADAAVERSEHLRSELSDPTSQDKCTCHHPRIQHEDGCPEFWPGGLGKDRL